MDQRSSQNTVSSKSWRWVRKFLDFMLDTSCINAQTVWSFKMNQDPRKTDSHAFRKSLAKALVLPHMRER